jgi:mRNA interferase MazF
MPTFKQGDIIKVPFPYTDRSTGRSRPALVVSTGELENLHGLLWVIMITSAQKKGWAGDVPITKLKKAGLPAPSVIRCAKIATIEVSDATRLGALSSPQLKLVKNMLFQELSSGR